MNFQHEDNRIFLLNEDGKEIADNISIHKG